MTTKEAATILGPHLTAQIMNRSWPTPTPTQLQQLAAALARTLEPSPELDRTA